MVWYQDLAGMSLQRAIASSILHPACDNMLPDSFVHLTLEVTMMEVLEYGPTFVAELPWRRMRVGSRHHACCSYLSRLSQCVKVEMGTRSMRMKFELIL